MILFYCLAFATGILISLFLIKSKSVFFNVAECSLALLNEVLSSKTDNEKANDIQKRIAPLLKNIGLVILILIFGIFLFILPDIVSSLQDFDASIKGDEYLSWQHITLFSLGTILPFFKWKKNKSISGYSDLSKLLHRIILNHYNVSKLLFKKDKKSNQIKPKEEFLIVTGLARSGTTSLMNYLSSQELFSSLNYANMPFILSPNLWKKIYNPTKDLEKERAHKDGIKIGFSSSEALEEYFFKVFLEDSYINDSELIKHDISSDINIEYLNYQKLIRENENSFYLAKNNNYLLRYESLRKLNKKFKMIVMLRDPLSHAESLLKQHESFIKQHESDSFVLEYMNWLGHHEFGLNQKAFHFNNSNLITETDKSTIDYWLEVWLNYYTYLLSIDLSEVSIIDYSEYCSDPLQHLNFVFNQFGVKPLTNNINPFISNKSTQTDYSKSSLDEALKVYEALKEKAIVTLR